MLLVNPVGAWRMLCRKTSACLQIDPHSKIRAGGKLDTEALNKQLNC